MWLLVGLGNPGAKYAGNRHNVGFMTLDELARGLSVDGFRDKFKAQFARGRIGDEDVVLLKPQTFMNLSGESVQEAMRFFKVPLQRVVVVHDELDLPFGVLRLKQGGGTAGHNGLKSIVSHGGGPDFVRLRVGIDRPPSGAPERHVLSDFSSKERVSLADVLETASAALRGIVEQGVTATMNRTNAKQ